MELRNLKKFFFASNNAAIKHLKSVASSSIWSSTLGF